MLNEFGLQNSYFVSPQEAHFFHEVNQLNTDPSAEVAQKIIISAPLAASDNSLDVKATLLSKILNRIKRAFTSEKAELVYDNIIENQPQIVPSEITRTIHSKVPTTWSKLNEAIKLIFQGLTSLFKYKVLKKGSKVAFPQGDEGKILKTTYLDPNGKVVGKEEIHREDTITDSIGSKKQELLYFEEMYNELVSNSKLKIDLLEIEINKNNKQLESKLKELNNVPDFGDPEYITFTNHGMKFDSRKIQLLADVKELKNQINEANIQINEQINEINKPVTALSDKIKKLDEEVKNREKNSNNDTWVTAGRIRDEGKYHLKHKTGLSHKDTYIPALTNLRVHTIISPDEQEKISIVRSGAISDLSDGSTNLAELKERYENTSESLKDVEKGRLDVRRNIVKDQFIQWVTSHIKASDSFNNPDSVTRKTKKFQITQVGLLNPSVTGISHGVEKSERSQMLDMAVIFEELNGKKIKFIEGIEFPFMNDDDMFMMPKSLLGEIDETQWGQLKDQEFELSCTFFNLSVHGNKDISDEQREEQNEINRAAIQNLQKNINTLKHEPSVNENVQELQKRLNEIEEEIIQGKSNYDIAEKILLLQKDMKGSIGADCYSGKDRTSYLLIKMAYHFFSKPLEDEYGYFFSDEDEFLEEAKRKLANDLISTEASASQVIEQNTGFKYMKLKLDTKMLGMNSEDDNYGAVGTLYRAAYGINALAAKA
jgi:hypothetical protein